MSLRDWWFPARRGRPHEASHVEFRDVDDERSHRGDDHTDDQDHPSVAELLFGVMEARGDLVWSMMGKDDEGRLTLGIVTGDAPGSRWLSTTFPGREALPNVFSQPSATGDARKPLTCKYTATYTLKRNVLSVLDSRWQSRNRVVDQRSRCWAALVDSGL